MTDTVPLPIVRYLTAATPEAVADAFAADGEATDEGRTHRGRDAIIAWREGVAAVPYTQELLSATTQGDRTVISTRITGDFKGSPAHLDLTFDLAGDRIGRLTIF